MLVFVYEAPAIKRPGITTNVRVHVSIARCALQWTRLIKTHVCAHAMRMQNVLRTNHYVMELIGLRPNSVTVNDKAKLEVTNIYSCNTCEHKCIFWNYYWTEFDNWYWLHTCNGHFQKLLKHTGNNVLTSLKIMKFVKSFRN